MTVTGMLFATLAVVILFRVFKEYMIAFNFADVNEARDMKNVVDSKLMAKRRKEEKRSKNTISLEEPRMKLPNRGDTIQIRTKYTDPGKVTFFFSKSLEK